MLQDALDADLSWRVKEFSCLKHALKQKDSIKRNTMIRAGIPLAYAHWEGFVKSAAESYLSYVASKKMSFDDLAVNFVAIGAKKHIHDLVESRKSKRNIEVANFFLDGVNGRAEFKIDVAINTESNLSSSVFENIALTIGIDHKKYETKSQFIDESLVSRRNCIAHGSYLEIDENAFVDIADHVIALLRSVKTDIENAASLCLYKRVVT